MTLCTDSIPCVQSASDQHKAQQEGKIKKEKGDNQIHAAVVAQMQETAYLIKHWQEVLGMGTHDARPLKISMYRLSPWVLHLEDLGPTGFIICRILGSYSSIGIQMTLFWSQAHTWWSHSSRSFHTLCKIKFHKESLVKKATGSKMVLPKVPAWTLGKALKGWRRVLCHALGKLQSLDGSFDLALKVWKGKQESQESTKLVKPVKKSIQSKAKKGQSKKTKATKTTKTTKTPTAKKSRVKDVAIKLEAAARCDVDIAQNQE